MLPQHLCCLRLGPAREEQDAVVGSAVRSATSSAASASRSSLRLSVPPEPRCLRLGPAREEQDAVVGNAVRSATSSEASASRSSLRLSAPPEPPLPPACEEHDAVVGNAVRSATSSEAARLRSQHGWRESATVGASRAKPARHLGCTYSLERLLQQNGSRTLLPLPGTSLTALNSSTVAPHCKRAEPVKQCATPRVRPWPERRRHAS